MLNLYVFAFDLDETLITSRPPFFDHTPGAPILFQISEYSFLSKRHPQFAMIEQLMRVAISNHHTIIILTASFFYTKEHVRMVFSQDILKDIYFFNGTDMAKRFGLAYPTHPSESHKPIFRWVGGRKGDFLKDILNAPSPLTTRLVCKLYDDSQHQCANVLQNNSPNMKMESFLVTDFSTQNWFGLPNQFELDIKTASQIFQPSLPTIPQPIQPPQHWRRMQPAL